MMQMSEVPPPSERGSTPELGQPTSWPTAFGVIGIILASLGLVGGCCGLAAPIYWPMIIDFMVQNNTPQDQIDAMRAQQPPLAWAVVSGVVGLAMSTLLLTGSINLLRRRDSGVRYCTWWAWATIPWSVLVFVVSLMIQLRVPPNAQQGGAMGQAVGIAFSSCMTIVLGIGVPVLFLAWFARGKIRQEVASWSDMQRARV
jgi:hypothetical protein